MNRVRRAPSVGAHSTSPCERGTRPPGRTGLAQGRSPGRRLASEINEMNLLDKNVKGEARVLARGGGRASAPCWWEVWGRPPGCPAVQEEPTGGPREQPAAPSPQLGARAVQP